LAHFFIGNILSILSINTFLNRFLCTNGDRLSSPVFHCGESGFYLYASSLAGLMKMMAECFESGIYSSAIYEQRLENQILQKHQPNLVKMALDMTLQIEREMASSFVGITAPFLAIYGDSNTVEVLTRILFLNPNNHEDGDGIKWGMAYALGNISNSASINALILALESPYKSVRKNASEALGLCGSNVNAFLIESLKIKNEFVNESIQRALVLRRASNDLIVAGRSEDDYVRIAAAKSLGKLANGILSHILNLSRSRRDPKTERMISKLREQADEIVFELLHMANDHVDEVKIAVNNSLTSIGSL
jgi:hypothetical protein